MEQMIEPKDGSCAQKICASN